MSNDHIEAMQIKEKMSRRIPPRGMRAAAATAPSETKLKVLNGVDPIWGHENIDSDLAHTMGDGTNHDIIKAEWLERVTEWSHQAIKLYNLCKGTVGAINEVLKKETLTHQERDTSHILKDEIFSIIMPMIDDLMVVLPQHNSMVQAGILINKIRLKIHEINTTTIAIAEQNKRSTWKKMVKDDDIRKLDVHDLITFDIMIAMSTDMFHRYIQHQNEERTQQFIAYIFNNWMLMPECTKLLWVYPPSTPLKYIRTIRDILGISAGALAPDKRALLLEDENVKAILNRSISLTSW